MINPSRAEKSALFFFYTRKWLVPTERIFILYQSTIVIVCDTITIVTRQLQTRKEIVMVKTLFELAVAYDVGGPEDGIIVRECTDYFDSAVNLFQPEEEIFKQVADEYRKENADRSDFVGCYVRRLVPEDEAKGIRDDCGMTDAYTYDDLGYMWY